MATLGVIMIGTGIFVFFSGFVIIRSMNKAVRHNAYLTDQQPIEVQVKQNVKTEQEFKKIVKKSMMILYVVGITCILVGILMIAIN